MRIARGWRKAIAVAVLVILASTVEQAESDVTQLDPFDNSLILLGEGEDALAAPAANSTTVPAGSSNATKAPAPPKAKGVLAKDIETRKPDENLTPVEAKDVMSPAAARASAKLFKQLSGMTDKDGKSVLAGNTKEPAVTSPKVKRDPKTGLKTLPKVPASPKLVQAMMAGQASTDTNVKKGKAPKPAEPKFRSIPFFKFSHMGQQQDGRTQKQCQEECAADAKCLSFSYSEKQECIISKSAVQYDLEFNFYAKKNKKTEGASTFRHLGAMKYVYTGDKTNAKAISGRSKENCENVCKKDADCKSFTYRARDKLCLTSTQKLGYSQGWKYFEKKGAAAKVATEAKYGKPKKGVSKKVLMKAFSGKKGAAILKPFSKVQAVKALKPTSKAVPNHALTPEQVAYLTKKTDTKVHETQQEIMKNALSIRERKLDEQQAARVAIAKMAAERAKKIAEYRRTKEAKGKNLYKTELRSSATGAKAIVEKASKAGWTSRERKKKAEIKAREKANKHTIEMAAKKAREKTRKKTQEKAQKELELTDAVKSAALRVKIAKDDLAHAKASDKKSAKRIKFLVAEQARAVKNLAKAADMTEEFSAQDSLVRAGVDIASEKKIEAGLVNYVKNANAQMPSLMKVEQVESINIKKFKDKELQAKLAVKGAKTNSKLAMDEAADAASKAGMAHSKAKMVHAKEKLKSLKVNVAKKTSAISTSRDKLDKSRSLKTAMDLKIKELKAWRTKAKADAQVLLGSSKFQEKQEIANEKRIKGSLGGKMKQIIVEKEKHSKAVAKLAEYKDQIIKLERAAKEQADERKLKRREQSNEKAKKSESKAADKVKKAKTKEKNGAKLLNAAKLSAATAVTVGQKVKAAQAESKAETLKVSGAEKLAASEPAKQKAKAKEAKANAKLKSTKSLMESDETKLNKANAKVKAQKKKLAKMKAAGPVKIAKAEDAVNVKLAAESAKLVGANPNASVEAAMAKAKVLHKKSAAAVAHVKELHKKYRARRKAADKAASAETASSLNGMGVAALKSKLKHMKAHENSMKVQMAHIKSKNFDKARAVEKARRAKAAMEAKRKKSKKERSRKKYADKRSKRDAKMAKLRIKEKLKRDEVKLKKVADQCDTDAKGKKLSLKAAESCSKGRSKKLLALEIVAKRNARTKEKTIKDHEKKFKEQMREKKRKETDQKRKAKERETKEKDKKKQAREKREKARRAEKAKKSDEKNSKEKKSKEKKTKEQEKSTKAKEKRGKETANKTARREKAGKEAKSKGAEAFSKHKEKVTKQKEKKTKEEAVKEKKIKEKKTKEGAQKAKEKAQKEKIEKVKAAERKKKELATKKKEQVTKETQSKEKAKKAQEQSVKEKATKEKKAKENKTKADEKAVKEKQQKARAREASSKERKKKQLSQEAVSKESAQKVKANEAKSKEAVTKNKANEVKAKSDAVKAKADAARRAAAAQAAAAAAVNNRL